MQMIVQPGAAAGIPTRRAPLLTAVVAMIILLPCAGARAASTLTVNTLADSLASSSECKGAPGDCSLRQALDKAHSGDTVAVPAAGSAYVLAHGVIPVPGGVTIQGAGSGASVISGNDVSQVLNLLGGGPVTIRSLTITHGLNATGTEGGGAVNDLPSTAGDLTLEGVTISDSKSTHGFGGAIEASGGNLVVRHSRFMANSAVNTTKGGGGAIDDFTGKGSTLTIADSVFAENSTDKHRGAALLVESGTALAITASTFSANVAGEGSPGGAIAIDPTDRGTIYNSTFTANRAGRGGAIYSESEHLSLVNDTLSGNGAEVGANLAVAAGATTTAENTIFAAPFPEGVASCTGEVQSAGHNLDEFSPSECGLSAAAGDLVGVAPELGGLADNFSQDPTAGGSPQTLALASFSLAVGSGSASGCATVGSVDERGFPRPGIPGSGCDIGAFELLAAVPTATTLAASSSLLGAGHPLTLTAAVSSTRALPAAVPAAGGTVAFRDGATVIGTAALDASGHASLTTSALSEGAHTLTASYAGDALHAGSSSAALSAAVGVPAATATATAPVPVPVLSGLRQSHRRWREGTRLAALSRARRAPLGTTFAFTLNTPSTVVLAFAHTVSGRKVRGRCVAPTARNRRARTCRRTVIAATITLAGARAGTNRISFQGRLSRRRRLAPGRYTLLLSASNSAGRSAPATLSFTIVRG